MIVPMVSATTYPIGHDVYTDSGFTQVFTEAEQIEVCQQNGHDWTGGGPYVTIRRVQSGGSFNQICNGAGECLTGLFSRTPAQMGADYTSGYVYYQIIGYCDTGVWAYETHRLNTTVGSAPAPTANFTGTPTSGQAALYVAFQDTSLNTTSSSTYNWSVSPDTGVIGEESTSAYPTFAFTLNGNYTITHGVTNTFGANVSSSVVTKTNYITVYNSTATTTTTFWAVDPLGHRVWDSAISLRDVQNSSWTNTSSPSGGVATIISLIGHTINGYATAAGYNDGETLGITADGVSGGIILMTPTNITNVSAGYVTLYVYVKESVGNAPISGAYVNLAYAEGGSTRNDGSTTSTEGIASFIVPNNTLIYIYGEKVGYDKVSTTKDSGSGSGGSASVNVILYMGGQTVTPTVTATTGPGGTVPVTVDPRTPAEKEADIANILIDYGDMLVLFFIALTVIGGVKMIAK